LTLSGWIKLHKKLLKNPIFLNANLLQLFIYCVLKANYEVKEIIFNKKLLKINRGQFVTGRKVLADDLKQNPRTTYERLKLLEELQYINIEPNNRFSLITVVNYDLYQLTKEETDNQTNNKPTTSQQLANTTKNNNNIKNKKKKDSLSEKKFSDEAIEVILSKELFTHMRNNNPKVKEPCFQSWAKHIDLMIRIDGKSVEDIREVIDWCQNDSFWLSNILSTKKLREKFDGLILKKGKQKKTPNREVSIMGE